MSTPGQTIAAEEKPIRKVFGNDYRPNPQLSAPLRLGDPPRDRVVG